MVKVRQLKHFVRIGERLWLWLGKKSEIFIVRLVRDANFGLCIKPPPHTYFPLHYIKGTFFLHWHWMLAMDVNCEVPNHPIIPKKNLYCCCWKCKSLWVFTKNTVKAQKTGNRLNYYSFIQVVMVAVTVVKQSNIYMNISQVIQNLTSFHLRYIRFPLPLKLSLSHRFTISIARPPCTSHLFLFTSVLSHSLYLSTSSLSPSIKKTGGILSIARRSCAMMSSPRRQGRQ